MVETRFSGLLPDYLKTTYNQTTVPLLEDRLFEPENGKHIHGYVGDTTGFTEGQLNDLTRIPEKNTSDYTDQLSISAVYVNDVNGSKQGGTFSTDVLGLISSNGGYTDDVKRLYDTNYYVWAPPIDYDKFINFSRYYWVGDGDASTSGEFIVSEARGTTVYVHVFETGTLVKKTVAVGSQPSSPSIDDLWEDSSDNNRKIRKYNGSNWVPITFTVVDTLPTTGNDGDYYYHASAFTNRPTIKRYMDVAGRWVSLPVVITSSVPLTPIKDQIYEYADGTNRVFKIYDGSTYVDLNYSSGDPTGTNDGYVYDTTTPSNDWSIANQWRHIDDLSQTDRDAVTVKDQATRPIIEFWSDIEVSGDAKTSRNQFPTFKMYHIDTTGEIVSSGINTTIFQYKTTTLGTNDAVLGFPLVYDDEGQFTFELTLESQTTSYMGYGTFLDTATNMAHSIWQKAPSSTKDVIGLETVSFDTNQNHQILTSVSRNNVIDHFISVIKGQNNFSGEGNGRNGFRWSSKNLVAGAKIVDAEFTLFPLSSTMQVKSLELPNVIRDIERDYTNVISKIVNNINRMWDNLIIADVSGTLYDTADKILDVVLSEVFFTNDSSFPYYNSGMGTFKERQMNGTTVEDLYVEDWPIRIPPSPVSIGAYPATKPKKIKRAGKSFVLGHEGIMFDAYGDARDDIMIELQNRFYAVVKDEYKDETTTFSASKRTSNFNLTRYYGGATPLFISGEVNSITNDHNSLVNPVAGNYLNTDIPAIMFFDGTNWIRKNIIADDVWYAKDTGKYHMFNGWKVVEIKTFSNGYTYDYSTGQYQQVLRAEFERYISVRGLDFTVNDTFDMNDRFTWNYSSAGMPGHYKGIYRLFYRTPSPDVEPWKIAGYEDEPDWWITTYVPDSIDSEGNYRYGNAHAMWTALTNGTYGNAYKLSAPIPVDASGVLLDPIAAGIVDESDLMTNRLDEGWRYRDGSPIEEQFYRSSEYAFAKTLLNVLMKPALSVGNMWTILHTETGNGTIKYFRSPHIAHVETMRRQDLTNIKFHLESNDDGTTVIKAGLNSWSSETIKKLGKNVKEQFGDLVRGTKMLQTWKTRSFVKPETLSMWLANGKKIPDEDVSVIVHQSQPIKKLYMSGVHIIRSGEGYKVYGYDTTNPRFTIDEPALEIFSGQVEVYEDFTASAGQKEYTVTKFKLPTIKQPDNNTIFSVLINGYKIQEKFYNFDRDKVILSNYLQISKGDIVRIVTLTTEGNIRTKTRQFVVEGVAFPFIDTSSGEEKNYDYGHYFETATEVISFLLGYGRKLTNDGWVFDDEYDWMRGAKEFATWVIKSLKTVQGPFQYTPFRGKASIRSSHGQVMGIETIQAGTFGIVDVNSEPFDPAMVHNNRIGDSVVVIVDDAKEIYGIRALVTELQHIVCVNNTTRFNDRLYDPVRNVGQKIYRVSAYRLIDDWNGRLSTDGFTVGNNAVSMSFETQVDQITKMNQAFDPVIDPKLRDTHREMYGWYPLEDRVLPDGRNVPVMGASNADMRQTYNYHRGMIHSKGTSKPITSFSRGLVKGTSGTTVKEEWLWKIDDGGDRLYIDVELAMSSEDDKSPYGVFSFVEETSDQTVTKVPSYVRGTTNSTVWNKPPHVTASAGKYQINEFPYFNGKFDTSFNGTVNMIDKNEETIVLYMFHFDPVLNWRYNDPRALREIDYVDTVDPVKYENGSDWLLEKVGHVWWDRSSLRYEDYHHETYANAMEKAVNWGRLKSFNANITRENDTVTVQFVDFSGTEMNHGLSEGDYIKITGAEQDSYNVKKRVTLIDDGKVSFKIPDVPSTPATGDIRVQVGFVDIYEWIMSPVPPASYDLYVSSGSNKAGYSGTPAFGDSTKYITANVTENGTLKTMYFFWVRDASETPKGKTYTTTEIESRLSSPVDNGIPWFAVSSTTDLVVYHGHNRIDSSNALRISFSEQNDNKHADWVFLTEGKTDSHYDSLIISKIKHSLTGKDELGNTVPDPLLPSASQYGTTFLPIRTVFKSRSYAVSAFMKKSNDLLRNFYLNTITNLSTVFPSSGENIWWKKVTYVEDDKYVEGVNKPFDHVTSISVANTRLANERYHEGDVIRVQKDQDDIWSTGKVDNYYVVESSQLRNIGTQNGTVELILDENTDSTTLGDIFDNLKTSILSVKKFNELIMEMARATIRDNIFQSWLIKSSYVQLQVQELDLAQYNVELSSATDALEGMFRETKPFHTKIRSVRASYAVSDDPINATLTDDFNVRPILVFDRLGCGGDFGWDSSLWNFRLSPWDFQYWTLPSLGTTTYFGAVKVKADGSKVYRIKPDFEFRGYDLQIAFYKDGLRFDPSVDGFSFSYAIDGSEIVVTMNASLPDSYEIEVQQVYGMTIGNFGTGTSVHISSYEYQAIRDMKSGVGICKESSSDEAIGGRFGEHVSVAVTTNWSNAYSSIDAAEAAVYGWNTGLADPGPRTFYIGVGEQPTMPPMTKTVATKQNAAFNSGTVVFDLPNPQNIEFLGIKLKKDVHYTYDPNVSNTSIGLLSAEIYSETTGGILSTYTIPTDFFNGYQKIILDGVEQVLGTDYVDNGDGTITFNAPTGTNIPSYGKMSSRQFSGNGITTTFGLGTTDIVNKDNIMVFLNGSYVPLASFNMSGNNAITMLVPPAVADDLVVYFVSSQSFNSPVFTEDSFVGDGVTTAFNTTLATPENILVFNNGSLVDASQYTYSSGTITFNAAPANADKIYFRYLDSTKSNLVETTNLTTTGTNIDPINQYAKDQNKTLVFLNGSLESIDAYTLDNRLTGDEVTWNVAPVAGGALDIFSYDRIEMGSIVNAGIYPFAGMKLSVYPYDYFGLNGNITAYFDEFYFGPIGSYIITSPPDVDYTVDARGHIKLSKLSDSSFTVNYPKNWTRTRNTDVITVRPNYVVERISSDHTLWDTTGVEIDRVEGTRVINTTDNKIYTWTAGAWVAGSTVANGENVYVKEESSTYNYNGTAYNKVVNSDNRTQSSALALNFPDYGYGTTFGTLLFGNIANATTFPEAFVIQNSPGAN